LAREAWEDLQGAKEARENFGLDTSEVSIAENIEGLTTWEGIVSGSEEDLRGLDDELETNTANSRSASESLRIALLSNAELGPAQHELTVINRLHEIVDEVGERIESRQVPDVSDQCNHIFRAVIQATERSHFSEVGVEPIHLEAGTQYGLYARDGNGGPKAIRTANGASRRALAVAYVLALTEVTGSRVPFVADSLLHALSGNVKLSTIQYLVDGERIEQPIIFCTREDVINPAVAELLHAHTGSTYTLTTQTRVVQDGLGDVARYDPRTSNDVCSVICGCSILEFCEVCEIVGDPERGDLVKRAN
jgi:DNA sulfur modification protein DndD